MPKELIEKQTIGQVEKIVLVDFEGLKVHARIDTGARTSSIWGSASKDSDGILMVTFFGPGSPNFTGKVYSYTDYTETVVASSNGQMSHRYKIKLSIKIAGRKIRASFTIANRESQVYPVLVGRNILRGKFVVDVKRGNRLLTEEKLRTKNLRQMIGK